MTEAGAKTPVKRLYYSVEDDEFIFDYVMKHAGEYGEDHSVFGNQIWKEMERKKITNHSWQSMRDRYLKHIQHCPPDVSDDLLTLNMYNGKAIRCLNLATTTTARKDEDEIGYCCSRLSQIKTADKTDDQVLVCSLCHTPFDIKANSFHICTVQEQPVLNSTGNDVYLFEASDSMSIYRNLDPGLLSSSTSSSLSYSFSTEDSFYTCSEGEIDVDEKSLSVFEKF